MTIHELVLSTDEGYYTVALFADEAEAARVLSIANALLPSPDRWGTTFEVRKRIVVDERREWTRRDIEYPLLLYIDTGDYFVCDHHYRDGECLDCGQDEGAG